MSKEPGGDSRMRTSSDEDESETLFPSANDPPLGEDTAPSSIFSTELSPPASQDPPDPTEWEGVRDENVDIVPQDAQVMARSKDGEERSGVMHGLNGSLFNTPFKADYVPSAVEHEPGYAWKNAKAADDYFKATEHVTDKNFSLSKHP